MPIGGKILDEIAAAIRLRDKVVLILSKPAIESDWIEDEVTKGFEEERRHKQIVLFQIRLDDRVLRLHKMPGKNRRGGAAADELDGNSKLTC